MQCSKRFEFQERKTFMPDIIKLINSDDYKLIRILSIHFQSILKHHSNFLCKFDLLKIFNRLIMDKTWQLNSKIFFSALAGNIAVLLPLTTAFTTISNISVAIT